MTSRPSSLWVSLLQRQEGSGRSLRDRTCAALREAITASQMTKGERLPATRQLATDLGISRVTAEAAYAQLETEGYLQRRVGAGTFVAIESVPSAKLRGKASTFAAAKPTLSRRGETLIYGGGCLDPRQPSAFAAGSPDLRVFPREVWQRLTTQRWRRDGESLMHYGDPQGYEPLRVALANYLSQSRGVRCEPEQVLILSSSQQALHLIATLMADEGDAVWMEDPGYHGAKTAFQTIGIRLLPVPVDCEGMDAAQAPGGEIPRLIYLTPSHQYPTGVPLSLPRRLAILDYAQQHNAWIVEDDYDSEFQYDHHPLPAMQGLDRHQCVLYVGTFSKVLFPSLRLAYAVLPPGLVAKFALARTVYDGHCPQFPQAVTTDFITQGHFAAHIRLMRQLYRSRRDLLHEQLIRNLPHVCTPLDSSCGLQFTVLLLQGQEKHLTREAAHLGVTTPTLSNMHLTSAYREGWVLGFSALSHGEISEGVKRLAKAAGQAGKK